MKTKGLRHGFRISNNGLCILMRKANKVLENKHSTDTHCLAKDLIRVIRHVEWLENKSYEIKPTMRR